MTFAVMAVALALGAWLAARPFLARRPARWPLEPPDTRDDVARAVSSLRDLEFARAAGTIDPADHARLRARLEASAFARPALDRPAPAPTRTFVVAALLAGIAAVLVVAALPEAAGDRAPGATITGSVPQGAPSVADLEAQVRERPNDIPSRLALADAYRAEGRATDAVEQYRAVLALEGDSVPALNGLGLLLFQSGSVDGALVASERVLALRPRDADALFLKGLALYRMEDLRGAVDVWTVFLDVGEFHPAAPMVRPLYKLARERAGP